MVPCKYAGGRTRTSGSSRSGFALPHSYFSLPRTFGAIPGESRLSSGLSPPALLTALDRSSQAPHSQAASAIQFFHCLFRPQRTSQPEPGAVCRQRPSSDLGPRSALQKWPCTPPQPYTVKQTLPKKKAIEWFPPKAAAETMEKCLALNLWPHAAWLLPVLHCPSLTWGASQPSRVGLLNDHSHLFQP